MADIEPYRQIQKTNIKEHNDIVSKINEIIDVINNTNLDTVVPKISALETEVSTIKATDSLQWTDIEGLKDSQSAQDATIGALDTQVKGITESLVSGIAIIDGITTGNMKVRVEREKAPAIDSNDYNIQKPVSMELIQGSGPSTFKAQITLSDGTIIRSDDFMFTTEAIGTDVYISSFVFKNGNVAGTISADIGLSNGTTIEANNFVVPMDPSLINTVQDLSTRLTAVEGGSVAGFKELEAQVNTNKTNIATLTTEIDDLDIKKADQSNSNQEIVAGTITATNITKGGVNVATVNDIPDISGKVNIAQGTGNAGKVLGINASGNVEPTEISSGGEVWEEVDLNNIPRNWEVGDRIKVCFSAWCNSTGEIKTGSNQNTSVIELILSDSAIDYNIPLKSGIYTLVLSQLKRVHDFNIGATLIYLSTHKYDTSNSNTQGIDPSNVSSYIYKMWRLKK